MLGPGHEGDARLGSGFKVAAELSGLGTEDGGETVVLPAGPRREGEAVTEAARCSSSAGQSEGAGWLPQSLLPLCRVSSGQPAPPPARAIPGQGGGICASGEQCLHRTRRSLMAEQETLKVTPQGEHVPPSRHPGGPWTHRRSTWPSQRSSASASVSGCFPSSLPGAWAPGRDRQGWVAGPGLSPAEPVTAAANVSSQPCWARC